MKKTGRSRIVFLAVAVLLAAAALWYVFPRTADDLFPELDWSEAALITADWSRYEANTERPADPELRYDGAVTDLPVDGEPGKAILNLLRNVKYRRSLLDLFAANPTQIHPTQPGDLRLAVELWDEDRQRTLTAEFWFDRVFLDVPGPTDRLICFTSHHDELAADLLAILQPLTAETLIPR